MARARLELGTTVLGLCFASERLRNLLEASEAQWRLVALKVPEARTQCRTIIVFITPVRFSERDTHLVL